MIQVIPTVLANTVEEFNQRLSRLLPIADVIQVDLMDGRFVPSTSVALNYLPDMKRWPGKLFEAHLMVQTPGAFIQPLARRGFKRIIIHIETVDAASAKAVLQQCAKYKVTPMLAINPETPIERLLPYLDKVEGILFLGVHPGFNGAPYVPTTAAKIRALARKNTNSKLVLQVDGGMTPETIGQVVLAGATRVNSGSFVSNAKEPKKALAMMQAAALSAEQAAAPKKPSAVKKVNAPQRSKKSPSTVQQQRKGATRAKGSKPAKRSR